MEWNRKGLVDLGLPRGKQAGMKDRHVMLIWCCFDLLFVTSRLLLGFLAYDSPWTFENAE